MMPKLKSSEVVANREEALQKIIKLIESCEYIGEKFGMPVSYYDEKKFLVTWNENHGRHGIVEKGIDLCDPSYRAFSGYSAILVVRNLFLEKQLDQFPTVEMALLKVGMDLSIKKGKDFGKAFVEKYVIPYNKKIDELRRGQDETK